MASGNDMLQLALRHLGARYDHCTVDKSDAGYKGPWDCSEFVSWVVYQVSGRHYGCEDDHGGPREKAYTGYWQRDVERLGDPIGIDQAAATVGGIVLRYPPGEGEMGHIAICDGHGGTVEARGHASGVAQASVQGRPWDTGLLIPWIDFAEPTPDLAYHAPDALYGQGIQPLDEGGVKTIQAVLKSDGYFDGDIDGIFSPAVTQAVAAYQKASGLVVDGIVGHQTATSLGIDLPGLDLQRLACTDGWRITGYFTPSEDQAHGDPTNIDVFGVGQVTVPQSFIPTVKMEGWGLTKDGWFLGWSGGRWVKGAAPLDARGKALVVGDVAVDVSAIPLGRKLRIPDLPPPWNATTFTAADTGGAIRGKHIDVYCGAGALAERASYAVTGSKRRVCLL